MRKKIRRITALAAMMMAISAMSVPAFAYIGDTSETGASQSTSVQTQDAGTDSTPAGTTPTNPIEDITGAKQPESTIDRSVTITDTESSDSAAKAIPITDAETLLKLMELLQEDKGKQIGTVTTNGDNLNVRTGSSTDYDIITQLRNGETVEVTGEENGWYKIVIPDQDGYVCGQYLRVKTEKGELITKEELFTLLQALLSSGNEKTPALTPDGNLTLVDDVGKTTGAGKQFVTMVTKNGNYFYLVIDRDDKGESTVHFLNQVDERDLFALMDEEEAAEVKEERAAADASSQVETPAVITPEEVQPEETEEPAKKSNGGIIVAVVALLVLLGAGGTFLVLQMKNKKKNEAVRPDPDADYDDDEYGYDEPAGEESAESVTEDTYDGDSYDDESDDDEPV